MGRLPDFLIIGASRGGTSSLWKNLLQNPQIEGSLDRKEIHFFNKTKRYNRGIEWYKSMFPKAKKNTLYFEASPPYFHQSLSIERIFKHIPSCKFILLLRNPVDRAVSHYSRWIIKEKQWNPDEMKDPQHSIVKTGIYVKSLRRWFGYFPKEQFLIIKSEDYFENERKILSQCLEWLDVDSIKIEKPIFFDIKTISEKWLPYQREVPEDVKEYLRKFYRSHNLKLYELLGRDLGW